MNLKKDKGPNCRIYRKHTDYYENGETESGWSIGFSFLEIVLVVISIISWMKHLT